MDEPFAEIYLNVTTFDGELLERIEVPIRDSRQHPLGGIAHKASIIGEIADAAQIVISRHRQETGR